MCTGAERSGEAVVALVRDLNVSKRQWGASESLTQGQL